MADFTQLPRFRDLVECLREEAQHHGWDLAADAAADILAERAKVSAERLGATERTVIERYVREDDLRQLVRNTIPAVVASGTWAVADPTSTRISVREAGHLAADLAQAGRLATANADDLPNPDLHNIIADGLLGITKGLINDGGDGYLEVGAHELRLARTALIIVAARLEDDWTFALAAESHELEQIRVAVLASMRQRVAVLDDLLPSVPPPTSVD